MKNHHHYRRLLKSTASVNHTLAAMAIYASRHGICEQEHAQTPECRAIMREVKNRLGETIDSEQVLAEMEPAPVGAPPKSSESASATIQGRVTFTRKIHWNNYARENGLTLWGLIQEAVDQRTGYREE